jgi:hypothetical protein
MITDLITKRNDLESYLIENESTNKECELAVYDICTLTRGTY